MPIANHEIGDAFPIQFVWRLPEGDYLRAVFQADILDLRFEGDKYIVRLSKLLAGRQETESGQMRPVEEFSKPYWALVGDLIGRKVSVAFEVEDGRPLHMRLTTLTGEHDFFRRFNRTEEEWQELKERISDLKES